MSWFLQSCLKCANLLIVPKVLISNIAFRSSIKRGVVAPFLSLRVTPCIMHKPKLCGVFIPRKAILGPTHFSEIAKLVCYAVE